MTAGEEGATLLRAHIDHTWSWAWSLPHGGQEPLSREPSEIPIQPHEGNVTVRRYPPTVCKWAPKTKVVYVAKGEETRTRQTSLSQKLYKSPIRSIFVSVSYSMGGQHRKGSVDIFHLH